jgi:phosphatidylglycerophosphatase A
MHVLDRPCLFLAQGFGVGRIKVAPGTFGTLVGIPFYYLLHTLTPAWYAAVVFVLFLAGVWFCARAGKLLGTHDHPSLVWDEIVGYLITMFAAPLGWAWMAVGFLLFRLFDIWKPAPIRQLDKTVPGGFGTMIDDAVAGLYACISLQVIAVVSNRLWLS